MADLRFDPLNNLWVAIARNRLQRPSEYVPIEQVQQQLLCPFCLGNEEETPAELASWDEAGNPRSGNDIGWSTRVVPNKFPSLSDLDSGPSDCGPYQALSLSGRQELLIPSPRHIDSWSAMRDQELHVAVEAWRERWRVMVEQPEVAHAMLFLNCRSAAGASLSHLHWQLIGSPVLSPYLMDRISRDEASLAETGSTWLERLIEWELQTGERVVAALPELAVFCPFASRFPLQTWIVPRTPSSFGEVSPDSLIAIGKICRQVVSAIESILDRPAYNILLHTAPPEASERVQQQWFFEIFPRLTRTAGFECGTNMWVNPVSPETAARRLRALESGSFS